jgi:hypothetical protein
MSSVTIIRRWHRNKRFENVRDVLSIGRQVTMTYEDGMVQTIFVGKNDWIDTGMELKMGVKRP